MSEITIADLWEVQLQEYPESRMLTEQEVADWVFDRSLTEAQKNRRAGMVVLAWQYPVRVWYRTHAADKPAHGLRPAGGWMGCRVGLSGGDYISGYDHLEMQ